MSTSSINVGSLHLNESERVEASCTIAREKLEIGDYSAGVATLEPWWMLGSWPDYNALTDEAAAELLLTAGTLSAWMATMNQVEGGQKPAEAMLSGAITLFERRDLKAKASEARIELACCYFGKVFMIWPKRLCIHHWRGSVIGIPI